MSKAASIVLMMLFLCQPANATDKSIPSGVHVYFATVQAPEDVTFAREQLIRYLGVLKPAEWDRALRSGQVKIARADLNDGGSPEIFITVENSLWCGSIGCTGLLLQKRRGDWRMMESPNFSGATVIMAEKKFGYHKLYTGDEIYTFRNGKTYEVFYLETGHITR